uniref:Uncharacterized protein n=1 Tax=Anopheles maculatus TaxID=74869 RepID=A0A182SG99_9DIPT
MNCLLIYRKGKGCKINILAAPGSIPDDDDDDGATDNRHGSIGPKVGVNLNIMSTEWLPFAFCPYRVSMMKFVTGAFRGSCEWAQDKSTERDVKLTTSGRPGGTGTSGK